MIALRQRAGTPIPVRQLTDGRYLVGAQAFAVVAGDCTGVQYLMIAGHALRKVP
jgi:hypothetical protein